MNEDIESGTSDSSLPLSSSLPATKFPAVVLAYFAACALSARPNAPGGRAQGQSVGQKDPGRVPNRLPGSFDDADLAATPDADLPKNGDGTVFTGTFNRPPPP
ncbi:hypothetical protein CDD83_1222 [Cordyceps sp. RAO-2017]|nr:hypothetical protein CDD83_1222 [Cordyceps sp. RAO-2017]